VKNKSNNQNPASSNQNQESRVQQPEYRLQNPASSIQHPVSSIRNPISNNKILIIEDECKVRDSIYEALEKENYEFLYACNGKEGLEIWEKENPILIILDLKTTFL